MENVWVYETLEGKLAIFDDGVGITAICQYKGSPLDSYNYAETELTKQAAKELNDYLEGKRKSFTVPLSLKGTDFQKSVWQKLTEIPYGETKSYKEIAESVGSPKAFRAVGMCNNKNPIPFIIPCHRVVGTNGSLTGYALGLDMKERLLQLEKSNI